jgi:hypothetical protein
VLYSCFIDNPNGLKFFSCTATVLGVAARGRRDVDSVDGRIIFGLGRMANGRTAVGDFGQKVAHEK